MRLDERWRRELDRLDHEGRLRRLSTPNGIDFSSNDYLGYARRPIETQTLSPSGTASRLLRGHHAVWEQVEATLANWHGAEAALTFTSGYVANEGVLSAAIESGDLVFSDQFNHASIIDGLRLSRAEKIIYPHRDVDALQAALQQRHGRRSPKQAWFLVTESLFGMEGDVAPLCELAELAARYDIHLVVDEAHATGCFGPTGSGLVDRLGLRDRVLATIHTGGKALAVPGAYVAGSRLLIDLLVNRCRHFIFTTALPPQVGAWWLEALQRVRRDDAGRRRLHENAAMFRSAAKERRLGGSEFIAAWTIGGDRDAVAAASRLQERGFDVRAIRPPTVPEGTARLRISIHADHDRDTLAALASALTSGDAGLGSASSG
jgi:8-amino-7-oxononanoate synthase